MPKYFHHLHLLLLCCCCSGALAQEDSIIRNITAHFAESLPEATDLSELTGRLTWYRQHPINLNHAQPEQLKELGFLSALQISNFFEHLRTSGPLKDLLELQAIDEFDLATIGRLLYFVSLKEEEGYRQLRFKQLTGKSTQELLWRYGQTLEKQKGYRDLPGSHYAGGPGKLLLKYKVEAGDLASLSITGDKDAGEDFMQGNNKSGFDFLSASLTLYKNGIFRKIVAGDYSLQFGQGLTLWTGSSFGKGPDVAGVAKNDTGLKPYTSTSELSFFRGLATTVTLSRPVELTAFISERHLDASLTTVEGKDPVLTTIGSSGLHRTASEIANKADLRQRLYGTALNYSNSGLDAGAIVYYSRYSHAFVTGTARYRMYNFQGNTLLNPGLYYNYTFRNMYFFGEAARSFPGGLSVLNGVMASINAKLSVVLLHRDYAKAYSSFYSQALGEGSAAANEKGIYTGLHYSRNKRWSSSIYADFFHFPWAKYRIDTASSGYELMWQLACTPTRNISVQLKATTKRGAQNEDSAAKVHPVLTTLKSNYRLEVQWKLNPKTDMKNRIEISRYQKGSLPKGNGIMFYQDVDYSPVSSRLGSSLRLAFFNTTTYDNRIYAYEDDVAGGAGSGLYNGRGMRAFLNCSYRLNRQLRIWLRYAVSLYPGQETIGSALDEITGKRKSDVRFQLRYQF